MKSIPHVVVIGGGFGGLYLVRSLAKQPVQITLIDRRNHHLFQPLLYQVATAGLSPGNIAAPLRGILHRQRNVKVILGEVVDIDATAKAVVLADGERVAYDYLVVAAGATHSYFGNDAWASTAPGLKTLEDAIEMRRRVLLAYEMAERTTDAAERAAWLSFMVVGAGPTGLELAGALGEMAHFTLRGNFREIDPSTAKVMLVEAVDRVLPPYPPELSAKAAESLEELGVTVMTNTLVTAIDEQQVSVRTNGEDMTIPCRTVLWAAGVQASPLGKVLQAHTGVALDRAGQRHGPGGSVAAGPSRTLCDRGPGALRAWAGAAFAGDCAGGDAARRLCSEVDLGAKRGQDDDGLCVSRPGQHGDDWPCRGSGSDRQPAPEWSACLAQLVVHPSDVLGRI